jgi:hypothetical protein
MKVWEHLVQQGILGTKRQSLQLPALDGLALRWSQLATADQETQFLQAAALIGQYRAAGRPPMLLSTTHPPLCPPETGRVAPLGAAAIVRQLLVDGDNRLLTEWLRHAARCHLVAPPDLLPTLLDLAAKQRPVAEALAPCLGERGRWLMGLNPAWPIAAAVIEANDWSVGNSNTPARSGAPGSSEARQRFLQHYRQEAPEAARALLETTWAQEAAKDRATFLSALRIGLSMADEPFLEQCLTDRSQAVRTEAARLLAGLMDSQRQQALLTQLTAFITIERKWLRRTLQVKLPAMYDPSWTHLGIREESPLAVRIGQKAGWLVQLVALLPPSTLVAQVGVDAVEFLEFIRANDFAEALTMALLEGAELHQDHAFLLAELNHVQRLLTLGQAKASEWQDRFVRYAPLLPPPMRDQVLQRYLAALPTGAFADWSTLANVIRLFEQLSTAVTTNLLTVQWPALLQRTTQDYGIGRVLLDAAYLLAPLGYPTAVKLFTRPFAERPDYIDHFLRIYQVRHQMEKEFTQ